MATLAEQIANRKKQKREGTVKKKLADARRRIEQES